MTATKQNIKVPISVTINNKSYFSAEDLNTFDAIYFTGTNRNLRGIVIKKDIPEYNIVYAYTKDNKLIISREAYARSKLYLQDEWVFLNVPKMIQLNNNKINIEELYNIPPAPEILILSNNEMFKDSDDNTIEIEVRGEREHNKCFFKAKDISKGFDMLSLIDNIIHNNGYIEKEHYKFFTITNINNICKKEVFLTYEGMIRLLHVSKSKNAKKFISWTTEKLFTIQLGTIEQKQELSATLLGINPQVIKNVFDRAAHKTPTVYLFNIGSANQNLKTDIYSDDDILCKYGCTEDISRRTGEHERKFKKEYNTNIFILLYAIIDPQYIYDAETNIKQYFKSNKLSPDDKSELVVINKTNLEQIKQHYKLLQNSYIGRYQEMNNKIIELEKEIVNLNFQLKLKDEKMESKNKEFQLNIELKNKELESKDREFKLTIELKNKDIELLEMKLLLSKFN